MVPVIIPTFRKPEQLERCLAALRAQTTPVEPFVHDNNADNIGFTRAVNLGLRHAFDAREPHAIILNQDCYLRPDAVAKMIEFMNRTPRCAIGGIKQLSSLDEDAIIHGGCTQVFPYGVHITGRVSQNECNVSAPMPWVNGACMIARMNAVLDFGLLDENMFLVGSDSDWCYSARLRKWEVWYIADAVCIHEQGASATAPPEMLQLMRKDMKYWREKWIGSAAFTRLSQV